MTPWTNLIYFTSCESLCVCLGFQVPTGPCCASPAAMARTRFNRSADHTALTTKTSCRGLLPWVRHTDRKTVRPSYQGQFGTIMQLSISAFHAGYTGGQRPPLVYTSWHRDTHGAICPWWTLDSQANGPVMRVVCM